MITQQRDNPRHVYTDYRADLKEKEIIDKDVEADNMGEQIDNYIKYSDVCIKVPSEITHIVQELHLPVYHALAMELEFYFYEK